LAALLPVLEPQVEYACFATVADAISAVRAQQKDTEQSADQVLVLGSFHTVAEAAAALELEL
jgi:folylpolyglutamate synthase/dihydropteroate synthase